MKYGNRSFWKKMISSPIVLILLIIFFILLTKAVWGIKEKNKFSDSRLDVARTELAKLKEHQENLSDQIKYLSTEQGIEAELRTKYRAVRDGESVAVIVDNDQVASVLDSSSTDFLSSEKETSWFKKFLQFFGF